MESSTEPYIHGNHPQVGRISMQVTNHRPLATLAPAEENTHFRDVHRPRAMRLTSSEAL